MLVLVGLLAGGCSSSSGGGQAGAKPGGACPSAGAGACDGTLLLTCTDQNGSLSWMTAKDCAAGGNVCAPDPNDPGDYHCAPPSSNGKLVDCVSVCVDVEDCCGLPTSNCEPLCESSFQTSACATCFGGSIACSTLEPCVVQNCGVPAQDCQ